MLTAFLMKIVAIVLMLLFFGFCIFIHELGHFLAAKWRGLKVLAFSIGFKKIWAKKIGDVEYRIGCVPFGGYVEIPQIDSSGEAKDGDGNALPKAKPLDRVIAAFAGPLFNILFGFALATVIWICGLPQDSPRFSEIAVTELQLNSPEYEAGLRNGDVICKLNGKTFNQTWNGFIREIIFTIGNVTLDVRRGGKLLSISYKPKINEAVHPEEGLAYPFFEPEIPVYLFPAPGSPAAKAGVMDGDHVVAANGKNIRNLDEFHEFLNNMDGSPVALSVIRGNARVAISNVIPEKDGESRYLLGFSGNPVVSVIKGFPFDAAGVKKGDSIVSIDGRKITDFSEVTGIVSATKDKPLEIVLLRGGVERKITVSPKLARFYHIGVSFVGKYHPTPWRQFENVIKMTLNSLRSIAYSIGGKVKLTDRHTTVKPQNMSGPIGIGRVLFISFYKYSIVQGLNLVVLITFSLGLLNLLPIPILDGGHIVLALLEAVFRKPAPKKILEPLSYTFVTVLIAFMLFISFYDVKKIVYPLLPKDNGASLENASKTQTNPKD